MTMTASGLAKLIEECGELIQVAGKKLAWYSTDEPHWDGSNLDQRLVEEMGDVLAAMQFICFRRGLSWDAVLTRRTTKFDVFKDWESATHNNEYGVDA